MPPRPLQIDGFAAPLAAEEFSDTLCSECNELLNELGDDTLQTIARRRLEGFSNAEIAKEIGCVTRTIDRKLERIRAIWSKKSGGHAV